MDKKRYLLSLVGLMVLMVLALSACSQSGGDEGPSVEESAAATVTAMAAEKDQIEEGGTGTITGTLSYPSEIVPAQRVVAFDITDITRYYPVELPEGGTYSIEVPTGTYVVLSYLIDPVSLGADPGLYAAYSKAVACGLTVDCTDHGLAPVSVETGEVLTDINPGDWYLLPGEDAGWPVDPLNSDAGSISGTLGYLSEYIPAMRVVAFDIYSDAYYFVNTAVNQSEFQIEDVPAGTYNVVAYLREQEPHLGGGYTEFVTCGLSAECTDHSLIDVHVYPGMDTYNINPLDFYALPSEARWPAYPNP